MRKKFIRITKCAAIGAVDVVCFDAARAKLQSNRSPQIDVRLAAAFQLRGSLRTKDSAKFFQHLDPHFKISRAD